MRVLLAPLLALALTCAASAIRGVPPASASRYDASRDFTCDGNRRIAFSSVNDDYCDCSDGTDEPGVSYSCLHCVHLMS